MAEEFKMCKRRCIYRGERYLNGCDYIYFTGEMRGCQPGEKCDKFEYGDRLKRRTDITVSEKAPESEKETWRYISEQRRKIKNSDCTHMVRSEHIIR